jgi:uncharacterized protein (DUF2252 family)
MQRNRSTANAPRAMRIQFGRALRKQLPRSAHALWHPAKRGRDPLQILGQTDVGRISALLPLRYGRMVQSPLAFLRGSAAVMAFDLAQGRVTGIPVQSCGDCHLLNFGAFDTPERRIIFDINDFDETLPAPWEWDIKRLAASVMVAGRYRGFADRHCAEATRAAVRAYRENTAEYAGWPTLLVWYARIDAGEIVKIGSSTKAVPLSAGNASHSAATMSARLLPKLSEVVGSKRRIKDAPPLIYHLRSQNVFARSVGAALDGYRRSLPVERRALLEHYEMIDVAIKVVGVGSVGTFCAVVLLAADTDDVVFLQVKQARPSVLAPYVRAISCLNQGERVVIGQRLMQSAGDPFLGWSRIGSPPIDAYFRQMRDIKVSVDLDALTVEKFIDYASYCGWAVARAHAKTGDAASIAGYLGGRDAFDEALLHFARKYADQTERDHAALVKAVRAGRIVAET